MVFEVYTRGGVRSVQQWAWSLYKGTAEARGEEVAQSPDVYATEEEARSQLATAKIAMRGARFAKVVTR